MDKEEKLLIVNIYGLILIGFLLGIVLGIIFGIIYYNYVILPHYLLKSECNLSEKPSTEIPISFFSQDLKNK